MGKTSSAVKARYNAKAYDRIGLTVKKGEKEAIAAHASAQGISMNAYIIALITADMQHSDSKAIKNKK